MSWELLFLQVAFIARVKRYEFILFIKRKKDKKNFFFDKEARVCAFQFMEILSKSEYCKQGN